jgi:hypothetical protein
MKKSIYLLVLLVAVGCSDENGARRALEREGYEQIRITGYSFFGCAKGDDFSTGWKAVKNGQAVEGVFCSGWFKGGTIRTY